jgi:hypothetical protein
MGETLLEGFLHDCRGAPETLPKLDNSLGRRFAPTLRNGAERHHEKIENRKRVPEIEPGVPVGAVPPGQIVPQGVV